MYTSVELRGSGGFEAISSVGGRKRLWTPDPDTFEFRMQAADFGTISVSQIRISRHHCPAATVEGADWVNLLLIRSGSRRVTIGDRLVRVESGCMAAHVGWFRYSIDDLFGSDLLLFRIPRVVLRDRGVDLIGDTVAFGPRRPSLSTHALDALGLRILKERAQDRVSPVPPAVTDAVLDLVVGLHQEGHGYGGISEELGGSVVERAMLLIRENYGDRSLTPSWLAERLGVSLRTLQRAFTAQDSAVAAKITQVRAERASELLANPAHRRTTVAQIAALCGFGAAGDLRRALRNMYGVGPSDLRPRTQGPDAPAPELCVPVPELSRSAAV
ncbi:helix-turn-helix domain-containing protein [Rhodococcus sp. HM1]|uniref:helix-turn-helix domain-containing protein n=1 Tax=Rhodococcus sp. HM1 TaxID=2937759 RepID=UPI00200AE38C|nr:helix-turn-helix domain-containing protein [Rhodococcus sp. HM1]MCK8670011.1 helix-turn-helix domain-containing protein [Rhodococcus sp. HM1]